MVGVVDIGVMVMLKEDSPTRLENALIREVTWLTAQSGIIDCLKLV